MFQTIAAAIIAAIPGAVAMPDRDNSNSSNWHNFKVGNAQVILRSDKASISVTGYLVRPLCDFAPHGAVTPTCKASMTRPAAAIAADIERKILAPLQPVITAAIERQSAAGVAAQQLASHIEIIGKIAPALRIDAAGHFYMPGPHYGKGYIKPDGSIYLERLSHDDAAGLLKFLFDKPA